MLRRLLIAAPLSLLLALFAASAVAAHDGPAGHEHPAGATHELRGRVVETHGDTLEGAPRGRTFWLETAGGERLRLDAGNARFTPGERVRVRGTRDGGTFLVADGAAGVTVESGSTIASVGATATKRVAVIAFTFSDNTAEPWTTAEIASRFFGSTNSVRSYFSDASYGQVTVSGDVFGWYRIAATDDTCVATSTWASQAKAAAAAAGVDVTAYNHVAYVFPRSAACGWAGLAYMPGRESWNNGALSVRVAGHELAHNFGVHHAASLTCTANGTRVTLSSSCTESEYGDPFDIMGASTRLTNNWHRWRLGYFASDDVVTVTAGASQHTIGPVSQAGATPKIVRVARGDGKFYYLEFRQPFGTFDGFGVSDPAVTGVTIRIAPDRTNARPQLLDANPSTSTFADAPFGAGRTFIDAATGIAIAVVSTGPGGAVVNISFGPDASAPSAPGPVTASATTSSATLAWGAATDNLAVSGYRVSRAGVQVADQAGRTFTDSGLAPATSYAYTVVAYDAAGNVGPPATVTVTTAAVDATAPTAPGALVATPSSATAIGLAWTAATDDGGIARYRVSRNGVLVASTATLSYTSSGLKPATTYTFTVQAVDAAGNVGPAATATATTKTDTIRPGKPRSFRAYAVGSSQAKLTWYAATDNVKVRGYRIYVDGRYRKTVSGLRSYISTTRGYHTFTVRAIDTAGNVGYGVSLRIRVR